MMSLSLEGSGWRPRRWWGAVAAVFAIQLALILGLGERGPGRVRPPGRAPVLRLVESTSTEALGQRDPTLFALPHRRGFSGPAWLTTVFVPDRPRDWTEPRRYLPLPAARLGAIPSRLAPPGALDPLQLSRAVPPEWALLEPPALPLSLERSRLRIEGSLARRPLLTPLELPPWQHNDLLTNTVLHLLVNAAGQPISATLLSHGSGLKKADDYALAQAKTLRFGPPDSSAPEAPPLPGPLAHLTWGRLVFEWHTLPLPLTNAPPVK